MPHTLLGMLVSPFVSENTRNRIEFPQKAVPASQAQSAIQPVSTPIAPLATMDIDYFSRLGV